jgi:exonuclease SbcD
MKKFLHTGDLHLKAPPDEDSDYSLQCLKRLIEAANEERVDGVLLCGDIFDKESDYAHNEFCKKVVSIFNQSEVPLYYIPGNHEDNSGKFSRMKTIDWGKNVRLFTAVKVEPVSEQLEILAIPHAVDYEKYSQWELPKKIARHRIAIAHGEIPGFTFLGDEESAGVLNPMIFVDHDVSHVFLGHIHLQEVINNAEVQFFYAGSPRPVRRVELGVRGYNIIEIADSIKVSRRELPEVGVVRSLKTTIMDKAWRNEIEEMSLGFGRNDRVQIFVEGLVQEDEMDKIAQEMASLKRKLLEHCRRVDFETSFEPINSLIENPFYKKIYEVWLTKKPKNKESREFRVWLQMLDSLKFVKEKVL